MSPRLLPARHRKFALISALSVIALGLSAAPAAAANPQPGSVSVTGERDKQAEDADEIQEAADQYAEARSAPGVVAPGAYSAAWAQLQSLGRTGGNWTDVTKLPYNSDDPRYRDFPSNSSGGAGKVTGRITGLAADNSGYVYAGAANGGVFRSRTGGGNWVPISEKLPSPATGDLRLDDKGRLWYATGEANTSSTAFVGTGVYVLADPKHGTFQPGNRVGGAELESTIIRELRFGADTVWAATNHGVWSHSTTDLSGPWTLEYAPNPDYLPGGKLDKDPNAPYKNIANDILIDPKDPSTVILAIGWRSGDTYNGFYTKQGGTWQRTTLQGDIASDAANVGAVTFASAADGSKFYAIEQSPTMLTTSPATNLYGVFTADSPNGPWKRIADSPTLAKSGSGIASMPDYQPGVQAWYNQFLQVDPADPNHLYLGLEEVFETTDAGKTWTTPGPYWNFFFPCWSADPSKQTGDCHQTTHPDQHAVTVGKDASGKSYVVVGNDGGAYRRPLRGQADASGHATDWTSLNDGSMDVLQYYSVGVGLDRSATNRRYGLPVAVSGGLQDNGQSIKRAGDTVMGSNFGGDGGDTIVDPNNGCNIAQEYTNLAMQVTNDCAQNDAMFDGKTSSRDIAPPDTAARFTAPFTYDAKDSNTWVAGGQHVWVQTKGWNIQSGKDWVSRYDLGAGHTATAVAASGGMVYVGWCGPCNNEGFARGIAVGKADGSDWHQLNLPVDGQLPNRYISGFEVDPANPNHVFVAINGFSRRWTEGPGAGVGHVFESRNAGQTWTDISGNMPDVPADTVKLVQGGGLVVGTDMGVLYRGPHSRGWTVLGRNLPTTTTMQIKIGPDGKLYAATHGRGIWSYDLRQLG